MTYGGNSGVKIMTYGSNSEIQKINDLW
jgi:hypothetical protein